MVIIENASHVFGDAAHRVTALSDVSLCIRETEFVAVVGPSGCGKSTLLRLIAGLIVPSAGAIYIDGARITRPTPDVGLVFQAPTLLPWANVLENVLFPLRMRDELGPGSIDAARALLDIAGLAEFARHMPHQLSGGMQQRVAICRGLIRDPKLLLMDEPFAALDALTREEMGEHLLNIWAQRPKAIMFVTHSVPEAVMLADRVIVMSARPGRIVDEVPVPIPRPRMPEDEQSDEFQSAVRRIRALVHPAAPARRKAAA